MRKNLHGNRIWISDSIGARVVAPELRERPAGSIFEYNASDHPFVHLSMFCMFCHLTFCTVGLKSSANLWAGEPKSTTRSTFKPCVLCLMARGRMHRHSHGHPSQEASDGRLFCTSATQNEHRKWACTRVQRGKGKDRKGISCYISGRMRRKGLAHPGHRHLFPAHALHVDLEDLA